MHPRGFENQQAGLAQMLLEGRKEFLLRAIAKRNVIRSHRPVPGSSIHPLYVVLFLLGIERLKSTRWLDLLENRDESSFS